MGRILGRSLFSHPLWKKYKTLEKIPQDEEVGVEEAVEDQESEDKLFQEESYGPKLSEA